MEPVAQKTGPNAFAHASRCYYWLHVHAGDGIIHIESPTQQTYRSGTGERGLVTRPAVNTARGSRPSAPATGRRYPLAIVAMPASSRRRCPRPVVDARQSW
jgi:hypothetical protein